jgi:transcription antitermination factor NusG
MNTPMPDAPLLAAPALLLPAWYAVYTRSRHESTVDVMLRRQSVETYLPRRRAWSRRRDRRVSLELPALPGYLFVRCRLWGEVRAQIKKTPGVIRLVENAGRPCVISEREVDSLRIALERSPRIETHPHLKTGDPVEVIRGPLLGVRGYLERSAPGRHRLVIRVGFVNRAVAVEVDPSDVEPCR